MAINEQKFRNLVNSVQLNDLVLFKSELDKLGGVDNCEYVLKDCYYVKTQDHLVHIIAQLGRNEILLHLIEKCSGLKILEVPNVDGKTPLHEAAQFSRAEIVRILLEHNVKVDPLKRADWTPLMLACTKDGPEALEIVKMLVCRGADLNLKNKDGWTPFHLAAREGDVEIMNTLIASNSQAMETESTNGRTALHTACLHGRFEAVRLILQNSGTANMKTDSCGNLPIIDSVRTGSIEILDLLAELNPDSIYHKDILHRNCLHVAAESGMVDIIHHLISNHGMHANDNSSLTTPLHWAAKEGQAEAIVTLLSHQANLHVVDGAQRTPLMLAIGGQHVSASRILIEHDLLSPFDLRVLNFAKTSAMKTMLKDLFQSKWHITLFLPGTD